MADADYRIMTDATGDRIADALESLIPIQAPNYAATIPAGQWSGSGSDYYITVQASNVTANSILIPHYDSASLVNLKGPVWCIPNAGSFTIHTSAIPSGTVTVVVQFIGVMGEAQYQVLADVYSTSQTYSKSEAVAKADIVNNLDSNAIDKPGSANMLKTLNDKIEKIKIRTGSNVITVNANSTYDLNDESFGVTMPSVPSVFINGQLGENAQYIDMKVSWVSTTAFWAKIKNTHSQSVNFTLYWAAISFVAQE